MQRRENNWGVFLLFFFFSLIIFLFSKTGIISSIGVVGNAIFPLQALVYHVVTLPRSLHHTLVTQLQAENANLKLQLAHDKALQNEDIALRDQFQTTIPVSNSLIPATIIGMPGFIPGVSFPESIILDKGKSDGIKEKDPVVYKNMLIGSVTSVALHASQVTLLTNASSSFTVSTLQTNASGILKGQGNGQMILDNVLLSDTLKKGDTVVTKGDESLQQKGFPPGLVIGAISSIDKNPSSLFQKAKIQSLLDITKLQMVFVIKE